MTTILVVDDSRTNRAYLSALLQHAEYRVLEAGDGAEALTVVRAEHPDLVISEILMPVQDGFEFVRQLRSDPAHAQTRVIFLSAHYLLHEVRALTEAGGVLHTLSKSTKPDELLGTVAAALASPVLTRPPLSEHYDREHVRLLTNKLARHEMELQKVTRERSRLEEVLQQRVEELAEADRHQSEFLAMLSHEMRNPLAPIQNALELIRFGDATTVQRARDMAEKQLDNLTRLVDDLLEVSAVNHVQLRTETVELAEVVAKAVDNLRLLIDACGVQLHVALPPEPMLLEADSARLIQVIVNLLTNAIHYTPRGGKIWLTAERSGNQVDLRIRDSGIGMTKELATRVFDLFTHRGLGLERSQGGLGIGLTVVRNLVEMHRGYVTAHSDGPGRGSEFTVRLPALPPSFTGLQRQSSSAARRRILVVDDSVSTAQSMAALLQLRGHDVRVAFDGCNALSTASDFHPEVVLLDLGMPDMDGFRVANHLRQMPELQEVLLVAVSGYSREEDHRRSKEAGFQFHLVKPIRLNVIEELLGSAATAAVISDNMTADA